MTTDTTAPAVPNSVSLTTVQFNSTDPKQIIASLRRLVQDILAAERAVNALISYSSTPNAENETLPHVLATTAGLDPDHTVSGLTKGQVLKAISADDAAFAQLALGELAGFSIVNPAQNQLIQFVDGYWTNVDGDFTGQDNDGANDGSGAGIYIGKTGVTLQFRSLVRGVGMDIEEDSADIVISLDPESATAALDPFTTTLQGVVSPPGAVNGDLLGDDGGWHAPLAVPPIGAGWGSSDGVTAIALPIGAITRLMAGTYTLKSVEILTLGGPGSLVVDIWKANTGSHYPPTSADDITGGSPPTISSGNTYTNTTLIGWTTSILPEDVFLFTLASSSDFTSITVSLEIG